MKPIYKPTGKAKEYGEYAINIYTGCPHRCFYCFAPGVLRKNKEDFHTIVKTRENIVEETEKQIIREKITGKTIHLCFACDPYPTGYDTTAKASGRVNRVLYAVYKCGLRQDSS